ncbi:hypothetical protein JCM4914_73980 [Streptomyces platensis subsp. malvinus]
MERGREEASSEVLVAAARAPGSASPVCSRSPRKGRPGAPGVGWAGPHLAHGAGRRPAARRGLCLDGMTEASGSPLRAQLKFSAQPRRRSPAQPRRSSPANYPLRAPISSCGLPHCHCLPLP